MRPLGSTLLAVALAAVAVGCTASAPEGDEARMKAGLDALYTRREPAAAAAEFRKVLEHNPAHYGATYQLAMALDRAGKPDEARPLWEKVLAMAESAHDPAAADTARARLAGADGASDEALMQAGLDALYARRDPASAADQFRKVLAHTPAHYGATYQLAAALDAGGKPAEARPLWEKVLEMAESSRDTATAETARSRLQKKP